MQGLDNLYFEEDAVEDNSARCVRIATWINPYYRRRERSRAPLVQVQVSFPSVSFMVSSVGRWLPADESEQRKTSNRSFHPRLTPW